MGRAVLLSFGLFLLGDEADGTDTGEVVNRGEVFGKTGQRRGQGYARLGMGAIL